MSDRILESLFLDTKLWGEVIEWGVQKGIAQGTLAYLQNPHGRAELCQRIALGQYEVPPPHTAYARKDDGGERTFYVNDPLSRLLFHAIYLWLMRNEDAMIHPTCLSYHEGIGIGRIVKDVSARIRALSLNSTTGVVGRKFDIHHYFDTVPRTLIHDALDRVEEHHGKSSVIDLLRAYYDSDVYFDTRLGQLTSSYQGIKQGCAVSSWFANTLLCDLDAEMATLDECYVRYSDDILYVGMQYEKATDILKRHLSKCGLLLNEKKTEEVRTDRFVRFLGFDIRGAEITLCHKWVKDFQQHVDRITLHNKPLINHVRKLRKRNDKASQEQRQKIFRATLRGMVRFLYYGNGTHAWASLVLSAVNVEADIRQLSDYCLDALRAVCTGKTSIGGLGKSAGRVVRGKGRHVTANRKATEAWLDGFASLIAMRRVIRNKWLYRTLVHNMLITEPLRLGATSQHQDNLPDASCEDGKNVQLESTYKRYLMSQPDGKELSHIYAKPLSELTHHDLLAGNRRTVARRQLYESLSTYGSFSNLAVSPSHWFWQSEKHPEFVVLKEWYEDGGLRIED